MVQSLLLVEDDAILARGLCLALESEGYRVVVAGNASGARTALAREAFAIVLLDVNLPDGNGLDLCAEIRAEDSAVAIVLLTARADEESAVKGLARGATDYLRKPIGNRELALRLRRALGEREQARFQSLQVDRRARRATVHDKPVALTARELEVLCLLVERADSVVTREQLLNRADREGDSSERTLEPTISRLRKKLSEAGASDIRIVAEYGLGYRLERHP